MKIVYLPADSDQEWNSSEWRMAVPCRAINRSGSGLHQAVMFHLSDFSNSSGSILDALEWADVIVVQRNTFGPVLAAMDFWKMKGKAIVMDFDDAFDRMHPTNVAYEFWNDGIIKHKNPDGSTAVEYVKPAPIFQLRQGIKKAHLLTTPSERLCRDWQDTGTKTIYLPNYIDLERYPILEPPKDGLVRLGWGGSLGHLQSLRNSGIIDALKDVFKKHPEVRLMLCGSDSRVHEAFGTSRSSIIKQEWVPYTEWYKVLNQFSIGLAPLSGQYDQRRSWIKILEYMVVKKPWVGSKSDSYSALNDYGVLVDNMVPTWRRALLDVVENYDKHLELARTKAYEYGIAQSIDAHISDIIAIYQEAEKVRDSHEVQDV